MGDDIVDHLGHHDAGAAGQLGQIPARARLGDELPGPPGGADHRLQGQAEVGVGIGRTERGHGLGDAGPDRQPTEPPLLGVSATENEVSARPVAVLAGDVTQKCWAGAVGRETGDIDDQRLGLLGEHADQRGANARSGLGVQDPGEPDDRIGLSAVHQMSNLARHDRSIVHIAVDPRMSAARRFGDAISSLEMRFE